LTGVGGQEEKRLYEWSHDQVFLLAGPTVTSPTFAGLASEDGGDVYFATTDPLTWEDQDQRSSVYDARIGGGFSAPSPGPAPCLASVEDSCQGTGAPSAQTRPSAGTATFVGPGNMTSKGHQPKKKKKKTRHHHRKRKHGKAHLKNKVHARVHGNGNGRAGR
jgi:hypothetical protein